MATNVDIDEKEIMRLFLNQINFEEMSAHYFIENVPKLNLLDNEQLVPILTKHCQRLISPCDHLFEFSPLQFPKLSFNNFQRKLPRPPAPEEKARESLTDEGICDIEIEVANSTSCIDEDSAGYYCISALLAIHSRVLSNKIGKKTTKKIESLKLDNISSETFDFLKCYVYGLDPKITDNNVVDILCCGIEYDIADLRNACITCIREEYLSAAIYSDAQMSACLGLLNDLYQRNILKRELVSCFITNVSNQSDCLTMMQHDMFRQLPLELFEMFMFDNNPSIESTYHGEYIDDMWESCLEWSRNKSMQIMKRMRFACVYFCTL